MRGLGFWVVIVHLQMSHERAGQSRGTSGTWNVLARFVEVKPKIYGSVQLWAVPPFARVFLALLGCPLQRNRAVPLRRSLKLSLSSLEVKLPVDS